MKDYVDAKFYNARKGDYIPAIRLSAGGELDTHIIVEDPEEIFSVSAPSTMDNADDFNYILENHLDGGCYIVRSIDLDFDI
jgi:hypothetical protein